MAGIIQVFSDYDNEILVSVDLSLDVRGEPTDKDKAKVRQVVTVTTATDHNPVHTINPVETDSQNVLVTYDLTNIKTHGGYYINCNAFESFDDNRYGFKLLTQSFSPLSERGDPTMQEVRTYCAWGPTESVAWNEFSLPVIMRVTSDEVSDSNFMLDSIRMDNDIQPASSGADNSDEASTQYAVRASYYHKAVNRVEWQDNTSEGVRKTWDKLKLFTTGSTTKDIASPYISGANYLWRIIGQRLQWTDRKGSGFYQEMATFAAAGAFQAVDWTA
jgi:hypothetical protein